MENTGAIGGVGFEWKEGNGGDWKLKLTQDKTFKIRVFI